MAKPSLRLTSFCGRVAVKASRLQEHRSHESACCLALVENSASHQGRDWPRIGDCGRRPRWPPAATSRVSRDSPRTDRRNSRNVSQVLKRNYVIDASNSADMQGRVAEWCL